MSDLISREALMRRIQSEGKHQASQNANMYDPIVLAYGDCYAMAKTAPAVDAVEVVRCKDCLYWQDRQVMLSDGSCRNYLPYEPDYVTASVGINMGAHCTKHGFEDESGSWFWANACDFCSRGERRKYA